MWCKEHCWPISTHRWRGVPKATETGDPLAVLELEEEGEEPRSVKRKGTKKRKHP